MVFIQNQKSIGEVFFEIFAAIGFLFLFFASPLFAASASEACLSLGLEYHMQCQTGCPKSYGSDAKTLVADAGHMLTDEKLGFDAKVDVYDNPISRTLTYQQSLFRTSLERYSEAELSLIKRNLSHIAGNKLNGITGRAFLLDTNQKVSSAERNMIQNFVDRLTAEYSNLKKNDSLAECIARASFERRLNLIFDFQAPPKDESEIRQYFLLALQREDQLRRLSPKPR